MTIERSVQLDLGTADVHQPGPVDGPRKRTMATLPKTKPAKAAKLAKVSPKKRGRRVHVRADLAAGGALHVRSMHDSDAPIYLEGQAFALADDETKPVWIQLAKPGTFRGHPAGPFELNDKVFAEIIANFKATENRHIPIDFEHASEADSTAGSIPVEGAPAQGWIVDLKIQGGQLFGLVEWGDLARKYIKAKKYKFFSPAIRFNARDRVTGKQIGARMTSGGLTNNPFLDGMKPLAARDVGPNTPCGDLSPPIEEQITAMRMAYSPAEYMPRLRCILGLSDLSTAAECADQLARLQEHFDAAGQDPDASNEGIPMGRFVYALRNLVNAPMSATWDDVFECTSELIAAAVGDVELDDDEDGASMTDATTNEAGATVGMSTIQDVSVTPDQKDDAMSAEKIAELSTKNAELAVSLKDTSTKLSAAEEKAKETETKLAETSLSLKEEASKRETAETELKTLKDEKTARDAKDLTDRVQLAFETYKDAQKLTDDDKETMLIVLKAKPESFEKKYPRIPANQQHLLKSLTEQRIEALPRTHVDDGQQADRTVDMRHLARTYAAQHGCSLEQAQRLIVMKHAPQATKSRR